MKTNLFRKILSASRLTGQGKLFGATAAIQRALFGTPTPRTATGRAGAGAGVGFVGRVARANAAQANGHANSAAIAEAPAAVEAVPIVETAPVGATGAADVAEAPVVERPAGPRFVASSFTGAAGTRAFKLFEPAGFAGQALPLVVMLHGCTQDPDDFAAGTRMNELAEDSGFFVLYPAQAPRSNAHKCWNWFTPGDQRRGQGEPALIAGMTRHVMQTHGIDSARVYVAGLSAGGAMAAILAREYPDLFAAAGVHSGVPAGAAHDVASAFAVMKTGAGGAAAWPSILRMPAASASAAAATAPAAPAAPVIVFHGDADTTVSAANGDAVVAAVLASVATPAEVEVEGVMGGGGRNFQRKVWRAADAAPQAPSLAEHWVVHGAPHAWSGGASTGSYTDPAGPDASREMLRFFREHPRQSVAA